MQTAAIGAEKIAGRLATVEPARRRITVVPSGEAKMVELVIAERAVITDGARALTLSELVEHVGSVVSVSYRLESGRRTADVVTIEAPAG